MEGSARQTEHGPGSLTARGRELLAALANHWGCSVADVAVAIGLVDERLRSRAYAARMSRDYWTAERAAEGLTTPAAVAAARHRVLLVPDGKGAAAALLPAPLPRPHPAARYPNIAYTSPKEFDAALAAHWPAIVRDVTGRLSAERPHLSAAYRRVGPQLVWFAICILVATLGVLPWYAWPAMVGNLVLCLAFLALAALRVVAWAKPAYPPIDDRPTADLPAYTVLVPLYREANVVADLVRHLCTLDYPLAKLDIRLLIEADDDETIGALRRVDLPPYFTVVTIPPVAPRTKPKALNVGMIGAWGDLVTIYDAEDVPDRDQLRRAAFRFAAADPKVACLQARLRIDNGGANLLAGFFAIEYEALFRRFLPALERLGLPLPLGGTSNHIRRDALEEIGGWDSFNVTEDADLGLRMIRFGYRVATLDSDTWEEAPSDLRGWIDQRSRWYKGWLQTWIVHMRSPRLYLAETGWRGFLGLQLLMGGMFLAAIAHPILLGATILWLSGLAGPPTGAGFMPSINLSTILLGHGAMMVLCWLASADGPQHLRRVWLVPLLPVYMLLHAFAALKAVYQFVMAPHYWPKTKHGQTKRERLHKR